MVLQIPPVLQPGFPYVLKPYVHGTLQTVDHQWTWWVLLALRNSQMEDPELQAG